MYSDVKRGTKRMLANRFRAVAKLLPSGDFSFRILRETSRFFLDPAILTDSTHEVQIEDSALHYLCNPYLFTHVRPFWTGRIHEVGLERFLRRCLHKDDCFVDIGANYGHVSMLAAAIMGMEGRILAYEPNPLLAEQLSLHFKKEHLVNAILKNCALGNHMAECNLTIPNRHPGLGNVLGREGPREDSAVSVRSVNMERADSFVSEWLKGKLSRSNRLILKVDVEGYEIPVIEGFGDLLADVSACIIEVSPEWIGGHAGVQRLWELFCGYGMRSYLLGDDGNISPVEAAGITHQSNVVFGKLEFVNT